MNDSRRLKFGIIGKLAILVVIIVSFAIISLSFLAYQYVYLVKEKNEKNRLVFEVSEKLALANEVVTDIEADLKLLSKQDVLRQLVSEDTTNDFAYSSKIADAVVDQMYLLKQLKKYRDIYIIDSAQNLLYATQKKFRSGQKIDFRRKYGIEFGVGNEVRFFGVFRKAEEVVMFANVPLRNYKGMRSGMVIIEFSFKKFEKVYKNNQGLGETAEIVVTKRLDKDRTIFLNNVRFQKNTKFRVFTNWKQSEVMRNAVNGIRMVKFQNDYRGVRTLAAGDNIPKIDCGMVIKLDAAEIEEKAREEMITIIIFGGIILLISILFILIFSKMMITPINSVIKVLKQMHKGQMPKGIEFKSNDEIAIIGRVINQLVKDIRATADFARRIGSGDLEAEFKTKGKGDVLGMALKNMRDNLIKAHEKDQERNWIVSGNAEVSDILRETQEIDELAKEVIKYLCNKIEAIQGAFYKSNEKTGEEMVLEMKALYAFKKEKESAGSFKFAEGLVGQCAAEERVILRTEIPEDYVKIRSGLLNDKYPDCLLFVPLIYENTVYGVLEFAGFRLYEEKINTFLNEVSIIIARTIFNILQNKKTQFLLKDSQEKSMALENQREELQRSHDDKALAQIELQKSNKSLEEKVQEVNRSQKRMQLLLENASEVITIYEEDQKIRYISPSVREILGYTQNEMIGKSDIDHLHTESRKLYRNMFNELIKNPFKEYTLQVRYMTKNGTYIWLESTGTNRLQDPAVAGIIVNSIDITERRTAEREQRIRSKMQALSENSTDLILRLEKDGVISYINPVIETITGLDSGHFLNVYLNDTKLEHEITKHIFEMFETVIKAGEVQHGEMRFNSLEGVRIMMVNGIPEYDDQDQIESVLMVFHDVTTRKQIEMEILQKNKKINDSINYASRIQGSILPDINTIRRDLPKTFIFYKARDVVSGDFSWYKKLNDKIYLAACDCTGHGVPGALISLIGFFQLNDIVSNKNNEDIGKVLDLLDVAVTKTLKQDSEESKSHDGMDIAFCKIDPEKRIVEFAGAHRPIYILKNKELIEIKGDRFSIGGGKFKNQTSFNTTIIQMEEGDSFYICSDGFPDQFGGSEDSIRKFGPKRLRNLLVENQHLSFLEMEELISRTWEEWRGNERQTDDVLLIGVEF